MTGATTGIGQAIAIRFAEEGAHVGINHHKGGEELTETDELVHKAMQEYLQRVDKCGVTRALVQADVSKEDAVSRMFARAHCHPSRERLPGNTTCIAPAPRSYAVTRTSASAAG